jgi:hypothetical protein
MISRQMPQSAVATQQYNCLALAIQSSGTTHQQAVHDGQADAIAEN